MANVLEKNKGDLSASAFSLSEISDASQDQMLDVIYNQQAKEGDGKAGGRSDDDDEDYFFGPSPSQQSQNQQTSQKISSSQSSQSPQKAPTTVNQR